MPTQLNRVVVITQFLFMMRELHYPATRFPKILNQMIGEKNQNLINTIFMAIAQAVSNFIPLDRVPSFCKDVSDFFFKKAKLE